MSAEPSDLPPIDAAVEEALRSVPRPAARPEFKAELRGRFLAGERVAIPPLSPRRFGLPLVLLAAAAAVVLLVLQVLRHPTSWEVIEGTGSMVVDGTTIPVNESDRLARALEGARELETGDGELIVRKGDSWLIGLAPRSRVRLPAKWGNQPGFTLELGALAGHVRVTTGPGFAGQHMLVHSDVMDASIVGTAFAVDYEEKGTCVCCMHGDVEVRSPVGNADWRPVRPGTMCFAFREPGKKALWEGAPESHATPLAKLDDLARTLWPGQ